MKKEMSRGEAQKKIEEFFKRANFSGEEMRKIKRLAMKYRIRLALFRRKFCKKCLSKLKGKVRVGNVFRTVLCENCGYLNRHKVR